MPKISYKNSPLYSALKPLRVEANRLVALLAKRKATSYREKAAYATVQYMQSLLDLVNQIAKQFDEYRLLGPVHLVQLARYLSKFKKMLHRDTLLAQHGSIAYFVFQEIREQSMKNLQLNREELSHVLLNNKDRFCAKLSNQIGADESIGTIYELMKSDVCAHWPKHQHEIEGMFDALYQTYFSDFGQFEAYQFQLNAESSGFFINLATMLGAMPTDFQELAPFFNPDSITVNEKNRSIWLSTLSFLMPEMGGMTLTRDTHTGLYVYTSKTERHCFNLTAEYKYYKRYVLDFCLKILQQSGLTLDPSLLDLMHDAILTPSRSEQSMDEMGLSHSPQGRADGSSPQNNAGSIASRWGLGASNESKSLSPVTALAMWLGLNKQDFMSTTPKLIDDRP